MSGIKRQASGGKWQVPPAERGLYWALLAGTVLLVGVAYTQTTTVQHWVLPGAFFVLGVLSVLTVLDEAGRAFTQFTPSCEQIRADSWTSADTRADDTPALSDCLDEEYTLESWMNEYTLPYDPQTYQLSLTRPVLVRLEGSLLRIWNTDAKIPKRGMWNEQPVRKLLLTRKREFDLTDCEIELLPEDLSQKKAWSRRYPIRITINDDCWLKRPSVATKTDSAPQFSTTELELLGLVGESKSTRFLSRPHPMTEDETVTLETPADCASVSSKIAMLESESTQPSPGGIPLSSEPEGSRVIELTRKPTSVRTVPKTPPPTPYDTPPAADIPPKITRSKLEIETMKNVIAKRTTEAMKMQTLEEAEDILLNTLVSSQTSVIPDEPFPDDEAAQELIKRFESQRLSDTGTGNTVTLFARTSRQKEEWFYRLQHASRPLERRASLHKDCVKTLWEFVSSHGEVAAESVHIKNAKSTGVPPIAASLAGINAVIARVLFSVIRSPKWKAVIQAKLQKRLDNMTLPSFITNPVLAQLDLGTTFPEVRQSGEPRLDVRGLWVDFDISYKGEFRFGVRTKLQLTNSRKFGNIARNQNTGGNQSKGEDSSPSRPSLINTTLKKGEIHENFFQRVAGNRFFQAAFAGLSETPLLLSVEVRALSGVLVLNMPPPPSDRLWIGFREVPKMSVVTYPTLGDRQVRTSLVCRWIEFRLRHELARLLVLPNMNDVYLPFMTDDDNPYIRQPAEDSEIRCFNVKTDS